MTPAIGTRSATSTSSAQASGSTAATATVAPPLGLFDDAAPAFRTDECVARAGVLLALLAIAQSGVVECNVDPFLSN